MIQIYGLRHKEIIKKLSRPTGMCIICDCYENVNGF